jgi:hypothetical protein
MDQTILAPGRIRDLLRNESEHYEHLRMLEEHPESEVMFAILFAIICAPILFICYTIYSFEKDHRAWEEGNRLWLAR